MQQLLISITIRYERPQSEQGPRKDVCLVDSAQRRSMMHSRTDSDMAAAPAAAVTEMMRHKARPYFPQSENPKAVSSLLHNKMLGKHPTATQLHTARRGTRTSTRRLNG